MIPVIDEQELAKEGFQYRVAYLSDMLEDHPDNSMPVTAINDEISNIKALYETVDESHNWYDEHRLDQLAGRLEEDYDIDLRDEIGIDETEEYGFDIDLTLFEVIDRAEAVHDSLKTIYRRYLGHGHGGMGDAAYRMPKE